LFSNKKYKIIYADPPWSYNFSTNKKGSITGCAEQHYNTMNLEDIKSLPVNTIADDDCVLFMWVTFPLLKECLEVVEAWGFKYKTVAFTWLKLSEDGSPAWGCGFWTRSNAEICILATKGQPKRIDCSISQVILSKRRGHSRKPDEAYVKIEKLLGNLPRIELFARTKRYGWDAWGNQVPKEIQHLITKQEDTQQNGTTQTNNPRAPDMDRPGTEPNPNGA